MRKKLVSLPLRWRIVLGFLLTDELFAVCGSQKPLFHRWYALGAGCSFYLVWNCATFMGIWIGNQFPNMTHVGLDFAVAATFIAIVVPSIKSYPALICACVSLIMSVVFSLAQVDSGLIISAFCGMLSGYFCETRIQFNRRRR